MTKTHRLTPLMLALSVMAGLLGSPAMAQFTDHSDAQSPRERFAQRFSQAAARDHATTPTDLADRRPQERDRHAQRMAERRARAERGTEPVPPAPVVPPRVAPAPVPPEPVAAPAQAAAVHEAPVLAWDQKSLDEKIATSGELAKQDLEPMFDDEPSDSVASAIEATQRDIVLLKAKTEKAKAAAELAKALAQARAEVPGATKAAAPAPAPSALPERVATRIDESVAAPRLMRAFGAHNRMQALIIFDNGLRQTINVGDRLYGGFDVVRITSDEVVLTRGEKRYRVSTFAGEPRITDLQGNPPAITPASLDSPKAPAVAKH